MKLARKFARRDAAAPLSYRWARVTRCEAWRESSSAGITRAFTSRDDMNPRMNLALITVDFTRAGYHDAKPSQFAFCLAFNDVFSDRMSW